MDNLSGSSRNQLAREVRRAASTAIDLRSVSQAANTRKKKVRRAKVNRKLFPAQGTRWTEAEAEWALAQFNSGAHIDEIADKLNRTTKAVSVHLSKLTNGKGRMPTRHDVIQKPAFVEPVVKEKIDWTVPLLTYCAGVTTVLLAWIVIITV